MAYQPNIVGKKNKLWPQVTTWEGGVVAAKQGRWACIFVAALSIVASLYSIRVNPIFDDGTAGFVFIQGVVFIPIAIGVHKLSRIAMVLGLVWYCLSQVLTIAETKEIPNIVAFLLILMLINGTRGVFAVHRIPEPTNVDPADRVRRMQRSE
jgi:hypothetical protein